MDFSMLFHEMRILILNNLMMDLHESVSVWMKDCFVIVSFNKSNIYFINKEISVMFGMIDKKYVEWVNKWKKMWNNIQYCWFANRKLDTNALICRVIDKIKTSKFIICVFS